MSEVVWVREARKHIGLREIHGPKHSAEIVQMWKDIKRGGIKDDETAWCAAFVGAMLERVGIKSTRFESARSYLAWGQSLSTPVYGCIAVLSRVGGGHVGFVVGQDRLGNLLILGGNQSDEVSIRAFPLSRISSFRYPNGYAIDHRPLTITSADISTNEA